MVGLTVDGARVVGDLVAFDGAVVGSRVGCKVGNAVVGDREVVYVWQYPHCFRIAVLVVS